jgi:hypothetical protein
MDVLNHRAGGMVFYHVSSFFTVHCNLPVETVRGCVSWKK